MAANDIYSKNWRHIHNISELLLGGAQAHMDVETSLSASEGIVIVPLDVGEVIPPSLIMECNEVLAVLVVTENAWVVTGWPVEADEVGGMT